MELVFLCVNLAMIIIVIVFGVSVVRRWKSNYSIESQIVSLSLAVVLAIGSIVQIILAVMLGENTILAILQTGIWIVNVVTLSIYLRKSLNILKANKKD